MKNIIKYIVLVAAFIMSFIVHAATAEDLKSVFVYVKEFELMRDAVNEMRHCKIHRWNEAFAPKYGADYTTESIRVEYVKNKMLATQTYKCTCYTSANAAILKAQEYYRQNKLSPAECRDAVKKAKQMCQEDDTLQDEVKNRLSDFAYCYESYDDMYIHSLFQLDKIENEKPFQIMPVVYASLLTVMTLLMIMLYFKCRSFIADSKKNMRVLDTNIHTIYRSIMSK